ncbi:MAG: glycosyltransferase family 2 protein [Candidatus Moranbacteria bacterium]|nr:glycosyltransferase family 2 protein [Candidatus Moranbacteria bacterium]
MMQQSTTSEVVAAILVNYESGEDLVAAIWSLVQLRRAPDVFIVVDNASRDDSLHLAQKDFPRLVVIRNAENVGFAKAVNQGVRKARELGTTHVWLFNPDARARSDALAELILASRNMPRALFSPIIFDDEGKVWFSGGELSWWRMRAFHRKSTCPPDRDQEFLTGCALFIPLATMDVIGDFDEDYFLYYEDADFCLRAKKAGFQLCMVSKAAVDHAEVSRTYARKVYYLVYSGLLFFFKHTSGMKAGYMRTYVTIRKLKNRLDCLLFGGEEAALVRQAYVDFFRRIR